VRVRKANAAWGKELAAIWYVCLNIGMPSMKKKLYNMEYDDEAVDLGRAPFFGRTLMSLARLVKHQIEKTIALGIYHRIFDDVPTRSNK
jgi:hypothetical protein